MLPYALTRDVPTLVLAGMSSMYEDGNFYLDLAFRPELGTHDETGLGFCGGPLADPNKRDAPTEETRRKPGYTATVNSSGSWAEGGLIFCGLSYRELQLEWRPEAAKDLDLPQITVVELEVARSMVEELRAALCLLFDRDMPDRPRLELTAPPGPAAEQLDLPFP
jgi:hypothetical protein